MRMRRIMAFVTVLCVIALLLSGEALAGPKPVLGVVRRGLGVWQDAPLGELWEVTEENRDLLPRRLRERLAALFPAAFL